MPERENLSRERRVVKRSLYRLKDKMESILTKEPSETRLIKLEEAFEKMFLPEYYKFIELSRTIMEKLDLATQAQEEDSMLNEEFEVKEIFLTFSSEIRLGKPQPPVSQQVCESTNIVSTGAKLPKLPTIEVPTFDGDLTKFYSFKNRFIDLVHNNPECGSATKLHYLTRAMIGNAEAIVTDFNINQLGYEDAWAHFLWTHENKRAIIGAHFAKIRDIEVRKNENSIRELITQVRASIRGLKSCGFEIDDLFSRFLAFHVNSKLDSATSRDWQNSLKSNENYPTFDELEKFLVQRTFAVEERKSASTRNNGVIAPKEVAKKTERKTFNVTNGNCVLCSDCHPIYRCEVFKAKKPQDRFEVVKKYNLCAICLKVGHTAAKCETRKCICSCGMKHNYLLHFEFKNDRRTIVNENKIENPIRTAEVSEIPKDKEIEKNQQVTNACSKVHSNETILLPSAVVKFRCGNMTGKCKILLDGCSQATFVTDSFVRKNKLESFLKPSNAVIKGVGDGPSTRTNSKKALEITLISSEEPWQITLTADVVPSSIISYNVQFKWPAKIFDQIRCFKMADPSLSDINAHVEDIQLVIGARYVESCMCNERRNIDELTLRLSRFGWCTNGLAPSDTKRLSSYCGLTLQEIDENLKRFWQIDNFESNSKTQEEIECEKHFEENFQIAPDGKFVVRLPFKVDKSLISDNYSAAKANLIRIERKLNADNKTAYNHFMREYIEMKHMSLVENTENPKYYIPHREVIREESSTTPLRVVFNASSAEKGKLSLNDGLMKGPVIQKNLIDLVVQMRQHPILWVADAAKMYRMVWVHPEDRNMQRVLWRENPNEGIKEYCLNTVTYGTTPASFLATKCLQKVGEELEYKNPVAARVIKDNFYMDDLTCGVDSLEDGIELQKAVHDALKEHGFLLRKYCSNSEDLLAEIPGEVKAESQNEVKVLGVVWNPKTDLLGVRVDVEMPETGLTKRIVSSIVSGIFDPLGILAPVIVRGKIILQMLWLESSSWDEIVSESIAESFREFLKNLCEVETYRIPRCVTSFEKRELVFFCDASEKAYCSVCYVRNSNRNGEVDCKFLFAKTRVAPLKSLSIPKLELKAAKLVAEMLPIALKNVRIDLSDVYAFSDSTTVLCWLSKPASNWRPFVCNRVKEIIEVLPFEKWYYVKSASNSADSGTRGLSSFEFLHNRQWPESPEFVRLPNWLAVHQIPNIEVHAALEQRKQISHVNLVVLDDGFLSKFSEFGKLIRVVAYVLRFSGASRRRFDSTAITTLEFENAWIAVIRVIQQKAFQKEVQLLKANRSLETETRLRSLNPFLDKNGLLRVGGRLGNAEISDDWKHPVILDAMHPITKVFVRFLHLKYFHATENFLSTFLSYKYWLVGGRNKIIRSVVRTCVLCVRWKAKLCAQIMGDLPKCRVTIAPAFSLLGVDFCGPFITKCTRHRTRVLYKSYAAVFVCFATRCVHIETVSELSTEKFIEAFVRFISVRGCPSYVRSDNATNFKRTAKILGLKKSEADLFVLDEKKILEFATREGFVWKFNPPTGPHFGGMAEASVKSAKSHLVKTTAGAEFTFEEYATLFYRISAMLNSRPLCYRETPDQDTEVITPAHLAIGRTYTAIPKLDDDPDNFTIGGRYELLQTRIQSFWKIWRRDYFNQLRKRSKWHRETLIRVGQIVLVSAEDTKPLQWPLGKIERVFPGNDGKVRVVDVRFNGSLYRRPVARLVLLPVSSELSSAEGGRNVTGGCTDI